MSSVSSITSPTSAYASADSATAPVAAKPPSQTLGQADFLQLLSTQFQNQDPMKPMDDTAFIAQMATFYNATLVVTTGTNHDKHTLSGNVSDHFTGNAVDFGMDLNHGTDDGPVGDAIATAAFLAAGLPRDEATSRARAGGAQTILSNGVRIQIIWKTDTPQIGNHHDHVHVGIGPVG